jgi:hypothetical protein
MLAKWAAQVRFFPFLPVGLMPAAGRGTVPAVNFLSRQAADLGQNSWLSIAQANESFKRAMNRVFIGFGVSEKIGKKG